MKQNQKWLSMLFAFLLLFSSFFTPVITYADSSIDESEDAKAEEKERTNDDEEINDEDEIEKEESNTSDNKVDKQQKDNDKVNNEEKEQAEEKKADKERQVQEKADDKKKTSETKERAPPVTVDVRVETHEKTLVPTTEITVESFELMEYINRNNNGNSVYPDSPRAVHAIIKALETVDGLDLTDDDQFGLGSGGNYIQSIDDLGEFSSATGMDGWMYFIDNAYVDRGILDRELVDGESIVLYYTENFTDNTFSWFDNEAYSVDTGEPLEVELTGVNFDVVNPVEGATILIDEEPFEVDGEEVETDENGKIELIFDEPGTYHLSANRKNEAGERNIVRPYAKVEVTGDEIVDDEDTVAPELAIDGLTDGEVVTESEITFTVKAEDDVDDTVTPVVKVNGKELTGNDDQYIAVLQEGKNNIVISAIDEAGNEATKSFEIIYEKQEEIEDYNIEERIDQTAQYILSKGVNSEWEAIGLARAGKQIPSSYNEVFYNNVESQVDNALSFGRAKITDIERLAIAAVAIGKDPKDINGIDLIDLIYNSPMRGATDSMTLQGNNGPIFALIALDSNDFSEPYESKWNRAKLIEELLNNQNDDGSWALNPSFPSASFDITAMAIIGLAPYKDQPEVKESIERAIDFLSENQNDEGGFTESFVGGTSSEATSQTIIGLTAYGMDPTDEKFTKNGNNLIDHLLSYQNDDGGFAHVPDYPTSNGMATEQALQALVAYDLFLKDEGRLYDFTEFDIEQPPSKVDKEVLKQEITKAENIDTTNKTEESISDLNNAIDKAKSVLNNENASEEDVEQAINELNKAIDNLSDIPGKEVDKSKLIEKVEETSALQLDNKTPESVQNLESALGIANWIIATNDVSQADIDNALQELEKAIDNLQEIDEPEKVDKTALEATVVKAEKTTTEGKTDGTIKKLEEAIQKAKNVLDNKKATQSEVDDAIKTIESALDNLKDIQVDIKPNEEKDVSAGQTVKIDDKGKAASIKLPEDLPENTKITVNIVDEDDTTTGMQVAGTIVDVELTLLDNDKGDREYTLTLDVDDGLTEETVAIYHYNEIDKEWEYVGGTRNEDGTITANIPHFSKYGVFIAKEEDIELPETVDKIALEETLDKALNINTKGKTNASKETLKKAIKSAETVLADKEATQEAVDNALKDLNEAMNSLKDAKEQKPVKDNKDELEEQITNVNEIDGSKYTKDSFEKLEKAIAKAKSVLNNEDATDEEIAEAIKLVNSALHNLEERNVDNIEHEETKNSTIDKDEGTSLDKNMNNQDELPKTSTPYYTFVAIGIILLMIAGVMVIGERRLRR